MLNSLFNWRSVLAVIAIGIVTGTVFYSNHLAKKIAVEEKIKVEQWVEATRDILNPNSQVSNLASRVLIENSKDIPMIQVTETLIKQKLQTINLTWRINWLILKKYTTLLFGKILLILSKQTAFFMENQIY
jgi:hypothetical protein